MEDTWSGVIETGHVDERRDAGTKPIDFTYLRRFTFADRTLEREVLYLFAQHTPTYLQSLRNAASVKEWRDAAHTLKGSARAVGAWRVARTAETAEKLRFDIEHDRRNFALDLIAESVDEAIAYVVQVYPEY